MKYFKEKEKHCPDLPCEEMKIKAVEQSSFSINKNNPSFMIYYTNRKVFGENK